MPCWAVPRHQDIMAESPSYLAVTDAASKCCFQTQRHAWFDSGYTCMQQSMEAVGRVFAHFPREKWIRILTSILVV